ncbi:MAG: response regulator transcription factor [Alphaproteobacteria bacterium]|nr:MAG: response regulator transcription factor [Alphaproteobacteria bacterium]
MNKGIVLSVDDDAGLQELLRQYLEGEGYGVITACDGASLSEKLESARVNVILLDLVLPDADGISLITMIRSKTAVPIIVVSGKDDTTEKIVCLEMGADDYMTKPFEMRELAARIKAALRRVKSPARDIPGTETNGKGTKAIEKIDFNGFTLDRNQFQLFDQEGQSLDLTTGEFKLLEALALAPRRALSREQLFDLTRGGEFDAYDRVIDIQVGRIRKKLGTEGNNIIRTVRGVGYMFSPPE